MTLHIGIITDIHLGPRASFRGKVRKITDRAEELTHTFVHAMNHEVRPDLVLNLGDVVQDRSPDDDWRHYNAIFNALDGLDAPFWPVVGNHDLIQLSAEQLLTVWRRYDRLHERPSIRQGHLYYHFHQGGFDFIVLHTHERTGHYIWFDHDQLGWLAQTLDALPGPIVVLAHHTFADQDTRGNFWFKDHPHLALVREAPTVRELLERSGKVRMVLNGHLHWNNLTVHNGIPYVTLQSLIENMTDDEQPCQAWATLDLDPEGAHIVVRGLDPAEHRLTFPTTTT